MSRTLVLGLEYPRPDRRKLFLGAKLFGLDPHFHTSEISIPPSGIRLLL